MRRYAAHTVTALRIAAAGVLLVLSPDTAAFWLVYGLAGVSDVLDGFLARRLHTDSRWGERLDSLADGALLLVCACRLLPTWNIPRWLWIGIGAVGLLRVVNLWRAHQRLGEWRCLHTGWNRVTGLLLFLLPPLVGWRGFTACAAAVCLIAAVAAMEEGRRISIGKG